MFSDDDNFTFDTSIPEQIANPIQYSHLNDPRSDGKISPITPYLAPQRDVSTPILYSLTDDKLTPIDSPRSAEKWEPRRSEARKSKMLTDPQEVFELAKTYIASGNYSEAAQKLEFVSAQEPDWLQPKTMLIDVYSELDDWKACALVARSLTRSHPHMTTAHCVLAWALRKLRRFDEAVEVCSEALARFPESVQLLTIRGECHYDSGSFKQATADFHRSVEIHRRDTLQKGGVEYGLKPWKRHDWRLR